MLKEIFASACLENIQLILVRSVKKVLSYILIELFRGQGQSKAIEQSHYLTKPGLRKMKSKEEILGTGVSV